ncbi:MAG: tRNA pseudouridine(38-40) synthase TruA [Burkholderiaceae bacterium]|nr:tRNA pseudouridine(38-40) synthase TruA [Burkholderiaceae bacterium]
MRLALGLEYDGTDWNGWQTQPGGRTVQDQLESALLRFTGALHPTICAGRTDAGVHARGQVVHIDTAVDRPAWSWVRGLNALLPETISVQWAAEVTEEFHARFSARSRHYIYRLLSSPTRSPLAQRFATWCYRPLDINEMRNAASIFVGQHDFTAFRSSECQAKSPVRELTQFEIIENDGLLEFHLTANAFLHHMVRNLVGTVVEVGRGAQSVRWAHDVLEGRDRTRAARTFPAQGLCLEKVEYDSQLLCVPESKFVD